MRSLERSPYALQPPHPNALPASFSTAQIPTSIQTGSDDDDDDDLFTDPEEKAGRTKKVMDDAEKEARDLSLYACRLELKALRELAESLKAMRSEKDQTPRRPLSGGPTDVIVQEREENEEMITKAQTEDVIPSTREDVEMNE